MWTLKTKFSSKPFSEPEPLVQVSLRSGELLIEQLQPTFVAHELTANPFGAQDLDLLVIEIVLVGYLAGKLLGLDRNEQGESDVGIYRPGGLAGEAGVGISGASPHQRQE